ncbi:MAG: tyrosine-type recombinase/integrase [Clostridiales bacterium]|nr:tyrosine-type recombinase/integrase [Clostridiales bacterium]
MLARECLEEFKVECDLRRLSTRTTKGYYNNTALFLNYLEKHESVTILESIRPQHIKKYLQYLLNRKLSPTYINGILKCLRAYFKYADGEGYLDCNPAKKVSWQREGKVLIETFTDDEVLSLLNAFSGSDYLSIRNKLILAIAFDTGARNTEICSITEADIRDNVILIHGKGNKERHVPLTPYLKKLLAKYSRVKEHYFDDKNVKYPNLLLSRTGKPLTKEAMEHVFRQAAENANVRESIRCSPHTARHYYAQTNLRNGLDVYSLSRLLGHENINITKRYLQSLQDSSIVEMAVKTSPLRNLRI